VLLEVAGRPLICWTLEALRSVGITEVGVVVGYNAEKVVSGLRDVCSEISLEFIENPDWQGENGRSLHAARDFAGDDPFVLCMGDHLASPKVIESLVAMECRESVLCVDSRAELSFQIDDATKVVVGPDGDVVEIGKDLRWWNAVDTGIFKLDPVVFEVTDHLIRNEGRDLELSQVVRLFTEENAPFATCDLNGLFWADVDTLEDYLAVKRRLQEGLVDGEW
jgi:choline kinase